MKNLIILIIIISISACASQQAPPVTFVSCDFKNAPYGSAPRGYGQLVPAIIGSMHPIALSTVSITDTALLRRVVVQDVKAMRTQSEQLNVYARIVNCTDYPIILQARTQYLDRNQVLAEPVTQWKRMHLSARSIGNYQESSILQPMPDSFLIELREQL